MVNEMELPLTPDIQNIPDKGPKDERSATKPMTFSSKAGSLVKFLTASVLEAAVLLKIAALGFLALGSYEVTSALLTSPEHLSHD